MTASSTGVFRQARHAQCYGHEIIPYCNDGPRVIIIGLIESTSHEGFKRAESAGASLAMDLPQLYPANPPTRAHLAGTSAILYQGESASTATRRSHHCARRCGNGGRGRICGYGQCETWL